MIPSTRLPRRAFSLVLAAVLVAVNVGVPLLDVGAGAAGVEIAAQQDAGGGAIEHDHLLCIQHSASGWVATLTTAPPADITAVLVDPSHDDRDFSDQTALPTHQPRAPPLG